MRVSAVGWAFATLEETLHFAKQSAIVTHNHPEGIKGAQAVAAAIFWARTGMGKAQIKENITTIRLRLEPKLRPNPPVLSFQRKLSGNRTSSDYRLS